MAEYDLFLDESGTFDDETPAERSRTPGAASQLAGLLAPHAALTPTEAERILLSAHSEAGLALGGEVHGTALRGGEAYDALVVGLTRALATRPGWQPVRIVNAEAIGYGSDIATYTNMVAELLVRLCGHLERQGDATPVVSLHCARWEAGGRGMTVREEEYRDRLEEYVARARARRGMVIARGHQPLGGFRFGSGRYDRRLQVCDLLSNASFRGFRKCGPSANEAVRAAFGECDFTLTGLDVLDRARDLEAQGSFGLAVRLLADWLITEVGVDRARKQVEETLTRLLADLAALDPHLRDPHLSILTSWLEEIVEQRREPVLGMKAADWLTAHVDGPLRTHLGDTAHTIDWFGFVLHRMALTASNHAGALSAAAAATRALEARLPALAGRWEHAPLLIQGLIAEAVHLTDALEHERAATTMGAVAAYYGQLSDLMAAALPDVFPARVRSDLRGQALGTQLQAEMYAGLRAPERLDRARELNDEALAEFSSPADRRRQYQYRAQLETYAGRFVDAREALARGIDAPEASHAALAATVRGLTGLGQGFGLLHWLRLGAFTLLYGPEPERRDFATIFEHLSPTSIDWCAADAMPYPAHDIRRHLGLVQALHGASASALSTLGALRALHGDGTFALIELAADIEVAGVLWASDRRQAMRLLDLDRPDRKGVRQRLRALERAWPTGFQAVAALLAQWTTVVERVLSRELEADAVRSGLLAATRVFGI